MDENQVKALMEKYLAGTCTPGEKRLFERLSNKALGEWLGSGLHTDYEAVGKAIYHRLPPPPARTSRIRRLLPYAAAAAVLIAVTVGIGIWQYSQSAYQPISAAQVAPGTNRATLTLADGRTIDLSEAQTGIVVGEQDITYSDGTALGQPEEGTPGTENGKLSTEYYVLSTPKGGTYQVTLPDGSKVWLNANSTLKYPSGFDGDERIVELTGEGYFEVNRHKVGESAFQPFKVISNGQTVEVLGTQFNISAYPDETSAKTTLVEGSVRLGINASEAAAPNTQYAILAPGEQGILQNGKLEVQTVDVEKITAWQKGYFMFSGELQSILADIARWYDVEVVFDSAGLKNLKASGIVFRDKPLSDVLDMLSRVAPVQFEVTTNGKERRIVVTE